jgi:hypothetical protein
MALARLLPVFLATLAALFAVDSLASAAGRPAKSRVTLNGEVVELSEVLKPLDLGVDAEPVAKQVVLKGDDGAIVPLLSDDASRALFVDKRLRHRRTQILAERIEGLPYVQVLTLKVEDHGALRTPEYWCDICAISVRFPQACPCCQGPLVLQYRSDDR